MKVKLAQRVGVGAALQCVAGRKADFYRVTGVKNLRRVVLKVKGEWFGCVFDGGRMNGDRALVASNRFRADRKFFKARQRHHGAAKAVKTKIVASVHF